MTLQKRYNLKGLDLRSSDINRSDDSASDVLNVELNERRELVKRYGVDESVLDSGIIDMVEYKRGNELIIQKSSGLFKWNESDGTLDQINHSSNTSPTFANKMNYDEYNGVLYWTDPEGNNELMKYDGYTVYRAGTPAPIVTSLSGAGGFSYRIFLTLYDAQGNVTSGDYVQVDNLVDEADFIIGQMFDFFYYRHSVVDESGTGSAIIESGSLTVNVDSGHNYVSGDCALLPDFSTSSTTYYPIVIDSVTATSITFDEDSFPFPSFQSELFDGSAIETQRTIIRVFKSSNPTFGYEEMGVSVAGVGLPPWGLNQSSSGVTIDSFNLSSGEVALEDVYDTTLLKGLPPKCKYITFYNNIMILANRGSADPLEFQTQTDYESSIFWSDTGVGSTVETFPPFNVDTVGKSSEGEITGVKALSDNVVIGKERQIYYANGNPILQTFRTRSALTNGIGCISFKSLQEIEGGVIFMSSRGLYLARYGSKPLELSDVIEPIFTDSTFDLDLTTAKTTNDIQNEKLYIHIESNTSDDIVLVYDYLWKEWFLHKMIAGDKGFVFVGFDFYQANSTGLYKRSESYNDDGVAINAYYKTNWFHEGFPSIVKKWINFVVLSIGSINWTCNVKTQYDWDESTDFTDQTIDINANTRVDDQSLDMKQTKSMRLEIANNVVDEGMLVTGYEYEFEYTQKRPKGDS